MFEETKTISNMKYYICNFNSINDLYSYISETPLNNTFRFEQLFSVSGSEKFTKTKSFDEAKLLLRSGWEDGSKELSEKLKAETTYENIASKRKTLYDVQGFQCSVPRYLNGIPTNMMRTKVIPNKQKVVNIVKNIGYNVKFKADEIMEQSVKVLRIVNKLESQGYRVNLDIVLGAEEQIGVIAKVRIKNANERLNVSKLAFPLVHSSMLRRIMLRFIEVHPKVTKSFVRGYGSPTSEFTLKFLKKKSEYLMPIVIREDITKIKDLNDLQKYL